MDIEEVREKRKALEQTIGAAIVSFARETGVTPTDLGFDVVESHTMAGALRVVNVIVRVELRL